MGDVNVTLANGAIGGVVNTGDGIVGMILTGAAGDGYTLGQPMMVTSLADAVTKGVTVGAQCICVQADKGVLRRSG